MDTCASSLTPATAYGVGAFAAIVYVAGLYLVPARFRALPRDDPRHVRARMLTLLPSTGLACAASAATYAAHTGPGCLPVLDAYGVGSLRALAGPRTVLAPLLLTALLFLGPLCVSLEEARRHAAAESWPAAPRLAPVRFD